RNDPAQIRELDDFIGHCESGMQLLDVGAHWGFFALAALHFGRNGTRVLCIEPSPSAVRVLRTNIRLSGNSDSVEIVTAAAGAESGYVKMLTTGAGGADFMVTPAEDRPDTVAIRQTTLSEVCM